MSKVNQISIGGYIFGRSIGQGTFGKVKEATHELTGEKVAIKILNKSKIIDVIDIERVQRELHILKLVRHPNIIQLYEILETPKQLFIVMEYAQGGELFDYIVKNQRLKEVEACKFFQQIISGLEYMHKLKIVHRDLKPENLLLDFRQNIKFVDFGLSNTYNSDEYLKTACGSPCYAPPEGQAYKPMPADLWSCGIILFVMVCGFLPFEDSNTTNLYKKILAANYKLPKFVSQEVGDLIKGILNIEPRKRLKIEDIKRHSWYQTYRNEVPIQQGIVIGLNRIPIDVLVLNQIEKLGFNAEKAQRAIEANEHSSISTAYYLMLRKLLMAGGRSGADLSSDTFQSNYIKPNDQSGRSISVLDRSVEQSWESFKKQTMRGLFTDETSPKADIQQISLDKFKPKFEMRRGSKNTSRLQSLVYQPSNASLNSVQKGKMASLSMDKSSDRSIQDILKQELPPIQQIIKAKQNKIRLNQKLFSCSPYKIEDIKPISSSVRPVKNNMATIQKVYKLSAARQSSRKMESQVEHRTIEVDHFSRTINNMRPNHHQSTMEVVTKKHL